MGNITLKDPFKYATLTLNVFHYTKDIFGHLTQGRVRRLPYTTAHSITEEYAGGGF